MCKAVVAAVEVVGASIGVVRVVVEEVIAKTTRRNNATATHRMVRSGGNEDGAIYV